MLLRRLGLLAVVGAVATAGVVGVSSAATATSGQPAPGSTPTPSVTPTLDPDFGAGDDTPDECDQYQPGADATEQERAEAEKLYRVCKEGREPGPIEDDYIDIKPGNPDTGDENTPG